MYDTMFDTIQYKYYIIRLYLHPLSCNTHAAVQVSYAGVVDDSPVEEVWSKDSDAVNGNEGSGNSPSDANKPVY